MRIINEEWKKDNKRSIDILSKVIQVMAVTNIRTNALFSVRNIS
jgi:hypothetical protein